MKTEYINTERFLKELVYIPSYSGKNNHILRIKKSESSVYVHYPIGPGQFKVRGIHLPCQIPLDRRTFTIFGLFQAEAAKNTKGLAFYFTNSNSKSIKLVFDYLRTVWKVPKRLFRLRVLYWRKDFIRQKRFLTRFWKRKIGIKVKVKEGTVYRLSENAKEFGVASLIINSKLLNFILLMFLEKIIKPNAEAEEERCGSYLTGLFEGDGTLLRHGKSSVTVGLAFNPNSNELVHYSRILRRVGVTFNNQRLRNVGVRLIPITSWRNHYKLLNATKSRLFLDERNTAFVGSFLNNQYVTPLLRLEWFGTRLVTASAYAIQFGQTKRSAIDCLKRLEDLGFIEMRIKDAHRRHHYSMTPEGVSFLNDIRNVRRDGYDYQTADYRDPWTLSNSNVVRPKTSITVKRALQTESGTLPSHSESQVR